MIPTKNTITGKPMDLYPGRFAFSVSHTTRAPREGDGVNCYFATGKKFEQTIANSKFLEHAEVRGNYSETSFESVRPIERTGKI
jgi:guanylate kinase